MDCSFTASSSKDEFSHYFLEGTFVIVIVFGMQLFIEHNRLQRVLVVSTWAALACVIHVVCL